MAAPVKNSDPFGNDDLFAEFQKPAKTEDDWDDEMAEEERLGKTTTQVDAKYGRKHTVYIDSSDSEVEIVEDPSSKTSIESGKSATNVIRNDIDQVTKSTVEKNHSSKAKSYLPIDPACCVQVAFLNKQFAEKHKDAIEKFISDLVANDSGELQCSSGSELQSAECYNFYTNFLIDPKGTRTDLDTYESILEQKRPVYQQAYRKALPHESDSEEDEDACPQTRNGKGRKNTCWNCDGDHSLMECKNPRDHSKIAMNKAAFMAEKAMNNPASLTDAKNSDNRYHCGDDPRFSSLKAGRIGDSLKEALGLGSNDLPPYIYKMRNHGYPPGHLQEAHLTDTDISMFDKHGKEVSKDGQSMEDGEVDELAAKGGYDYNKIIEYAGFNVKADSNTTDYQEPPLNEFQLKTNLPKIYGPNVFRVIDGLERDSKRKLEDREEVDMDLANDASPVKQLKKQESVSDAPSTPSSTLDELEMEKQRILQSLEASTDPSTEESGRENTTEKDTSCSDSDYENIQFSNNLRTPTNTRSRSLLMKVGTPIGVDSEQELPDSDKFRQNITEHIPYENLPNATGMFSKMMSVMGKVRDVLSNIRKGD